MWGRDLQYGGVTDCVPVQVHDQQQRGNDPAAEAAGQEVQRRDGAGGAVPAAAGGEAVVDAADHTAGDYRLCSMCLVLDIEILCVCVRVG